MFDAALRSDTTDPVPSPDELQRAQGRARLSVTHKDGATRLQELYQDGCAKLRCPKTHDATSLEAVLLNTAGGLTGGDRIKTEINAAPGSAVTIASQACERIYRSSAGDALVESRISITDSASVEWLPQETILFDGGRVRRRLHVDMATNARLLAVEPVVFGRVASGETLGHGLFRDSWRIQRNGALIFADETRMDGDIGAITNRPGVLDGAKAMATVLLAEPDAERFIDPARHFLDAFPGTGVSFVSGALVSRLAAADSMQLRACLIPLLTLLRDGRNPPRAWQL
jgi:urease accessory protein